MDLFNNIEYENNETNDTIDNIIEKVANFNIYDFISRVAGLNLLSQNQNKSVLLDTLIYNLLAKSGEYYKSLIKMSDKRFKSVIEELNSTFLTASIDPCENTFIQNIMFKGKNYRMFNGIDITPSYNLQALIRVLFEYQNQFDTKYLDKVYHLFTLLLELSENVANQIGASLDSAEYNEERKVIIPSAEIIKKNAQYISIPIKDVVALIEESFSLDELCSEFGEENKGDINNRPFYTKPFLLDLEDEKVILLNISLLPAYALYKAFVWAEEYEIKKEVINRYNEYVWLETKKALSDMGHIKVDNIAYGIEDLHNDYYKEAIFTVYNNQLMYVVFLCDDGKEYNSKNIHDKYPDDRHSKMLNKRLDYYQNSIKTMGAQAEETYIIIVLGAIGRSINIALDDIPFGYDPIAFNPFELHCIARHERDNKPFLPRYIRAKNQLHTIVPNVFSELNAICIYTSNHNTFYMNDDIDKDEAGIYIAPGDSIHYITEALLDENRMLIDSYEDGHKTEVILVDKERSIYIEDVFEPIKPALCVFLRNIKVWILIENITDYSRMDIFSSLVDVISYWFAECGFILEMYSFLYSTYMIHISISGEPIEFYYEKSEIKPFEQCIDQSTEKNHIYLNFQPDALRNLQHTDNSQEKELCRYLFDIFDHISLENMPYYDSLDKVFSNPLKKRFYSVSYIKNPYLKPLKGHNYRTIHEEDKDFLSDIIGKELLKSGNWEIGVVEDSRRNKIINEIVGLLYRRLKSMIAEFKPDYMLEIIYQDLEEALYNLVLAESRYYSDFLCYPEKEESYLEKYNELNKTSLSLKFLIEYVTACPPSGSKHFGIGQYEELLAICSMIIEWAYKGDLIHYGIFDTKVELLKSKRIGMKQEEFIDMYLYNNTYRSRQLKYNSSKDLRKEYHMERKDFGDELEVAFLAEFGYTFTEFLQVVYAMLSIMEEDIITFRKVDLPYKLIEVDGGLKKELIDKVLMDITYKSRKDYLIIPKGFDKEDAYPWKFNRRYSFNRRPVLERGEWLIWGFRQLNHMIAYIMDLIYSGRFRSQSNEMKAVCGRITQSIGNEFNDIVYRIIQDMDEFILYSKVKKVNGNRIAENGCDLGDVDILIIDKETARIIVTEVKNFRYSRNPREINQEYEKMFVDADKTPCLVTKHMKRVKWIEDHLQDVKKQYELDERSWKVTSLFIVNHPLVSQKIFKQNIRCISRAELSVDAIRQA